MKVLQVVRQFYPSTGGMEKITFQLCQRLQAKGHQSDVLTLNVDFSSKARLPYRESIDGVAVHRVGYLGSPRYTLAPRAISYLAPYDLIHIHGVDFFVDYFTATKPLHRKPIVISTHGGYFHTPWGMTFKRLYFQTITRFVLRATDTVICDSAHDLSIFNMIAPNKTTLIHNGVDYKSFAKVEKAIEPGLLVYIGRISRNKQLDKLIVVFQNAVSEEPEARLVIVGPDWEHLQGQLESLAQQLGMADRVEFAGQKSEEELKGYLARAHLFVSASGYEAFGISAVEAMSTGTVPILNRIPAFEELLGSEECGFLADFDQPEAASQTILQALRLPIPTIMAMGEKAKANASRFDWDKVINEYESVYASVLESRRS